MKHLHKIFMPCILLMLISGLLGGVSRFGWFNDSVPVSLIAFHGPLMICGFLGTLIGLERAAAGVHHWLYAAPVLTVFGTLLLLLGANSTLGPLVILCAIALHLFDFFLSLDQLNLAALTNLLGLISWFLGTLGWLRQMPIQQVSLWWGCFLILTIFSSHIQLQNFKSIKVVSSLFTLGLWCVSSGLLLTYFMPDNGLRTMSLGLFILSMIGCAQIKIKVAQQEQGKAYFLTCLVGAYFWLSFDCLMMFILGSDSLALRWYDLSLHGLFVGFVFSMIFAHAPGIMPKLLRLQNVYHPVLFIPLVCLEGSLLLRAYATMPSQFSLKALGGLLNLLSLLLFIGILMVLIFRKKKAQMFQPVPTDRQNT